MSAPRIITAKEVICVMSDKFSDPQMQQYFSTLSPYIQETITQSAVELTDAQSMKQFAENLMRKNPSSSL